MNQADEVNNLENDLADSEEKFDLTGLFLDIAAKWKWILLCVLLFGGAAYYYVLTIVPLYQVDASIYINSKSADATSQTMMELNKAFNQDRDIEKNTEIQILMSKNNMLRIVDSLGLAYSYYTKGRMRDVPVYHCSPVVAKMDSVSLTQLHTSVIFRIDKGDVAGTYDIRAYVGSEESDETKHLKNAKLPVAMQFSVGKVTLSQSPFTTRLDAPEKIVIQNARNIASRLSESIAFRPVESAPSVLNMDMKTPCIEEGVDVFKALVNFYNKQIIEEKNRSAVQMETFILDRLTMITGELSDVEERLRRYREAHNIADLSAQTGLNLNAQNTNDAELAEVDASIAMLREVEGMVLRQDKYEPLPNFAQDAAVSQSIESYNQAVSNYKRALESMGESHPSLTPMRDALITQKAQIVSSIRSAESSLNKRRSSLSSLRSRSAGELAAQPSVDKGLNEIFREQQVKVNIYTYLLQKREEIALQKTLATPTVQFLDNPVGYGPVSPKRSLYVLIGCLIGLVVPIVIITLRRVLFPKFNDKEDLQRLTKVPILGEICKSEDSDSQLVVGDGLATPVAELFRLLRNNVDFTAAGHTSDKGRVILITSSISGEGKTFITYNLAATYALTNKRVVVLGLDIRRPVLARIAGLNNNTGVTSFLSGQFDDLDSLLHQSPVSENLFILPAGPIPPNPNELLLSPNMQKMFEQLRREFDVVIVDTAPIGMVSDTFLIAPYSDIQLYVTRAGVSTKRSLTSLHDAVRMHRLPHPYLVLNYVNVGSTAYIFRRYGHYGYYGYKTYGYAYGYGYDSKKKKTHWWQRLLPGKQGHHHHHHHHHSKK